MHFYHQHISYRFFLKANYDWLSGKEAEMKLLLCIWFFSFFKFKSAISVCMPIGDAHHALIASASSIRGMRVYGDQEQFLTHKCPILSESNTKTRNQTRDRDFLIETESRKCLQDVAVIWRRRRAAFFKRDFFKQGTKCDSFWSKIKEAVTWKPSVVDHFRA